MGLETGTFVDDLVITNPPGGDDKRQGDDHLRLIKTVLKNTLKRATKAFYFPASISKTANYTVLSTDNGYTIVVDTSGGFFTLTLPALTVSDDGWSIEVVKTNSSSTPVLITPASGQVGGFNVIRRSVPLYPTKILWTGSTWVVTRSNGSPIGSIIDYHGSTLPDGFLWADGSAFNSTLYPELNAVLGAVVVPDYRGRIGAGLDNLGGSAAGRLTGFTSLGGAGGNQNGVAAHTHTFTSGSSNVDHTHHVPSLNTQSVQSGVGATVVTGYGAIGSATTDGASVPHTHSGTTDSGGSAGGNVQPTMGCNKLVVAE